MSDHTFSTNQRNIMRHIFLTLTLALLTGIPTLSLYAGTISATGTLSKEITSTTNTAAITVRDCDGNVLSLVKQLQLQSMNHMQKVGKHCASK
jgi:hypothetical protein